MASLGQGDYSFHFTRPVKVWVLDVVWGSVVGARKVYCPVTLAFGLCYTVLPYLRVSKLRQSRWGKDRS